jgi:cephalosporin hydroxylase
MQSEKLIQKSGNPLLDYFINNSDRVIHKWLSYFDVYHRHLHGYRNKQIKFLEIGMQNGGSTQMWRNYFGSNATIIGVDIDEKCRELEKEGFEVWIGDQENLTFWEQFKIKHSSLDVVLDDGGHTMKQQINTFISLFPILNEGGIFICEDTHSSYFPDLGGGLKQEGTFHEYVKGLMDEMHAWYFQKISTLPSNYFANNLYAIHVYESLIIFEKRKKTMPMALHTGSIGFINHNQALLTYKDLRASFNVSAE